MRCVSSRPKGKAGLCSDSGQSRWQGRIFLFLALEAPGLHADPSPRPTHAPQGACLRERDFPKWAQRRVNISSTFSWGATKEGKPSRNVQLRGGQKASPSPHKNSRTR